MSATVILYKPTNIKFIKGNIFKYNPSDITEELSENSTNIYREICDSADIKFGLDDSDSKKKWIDEECFIKDPLDVGHYEDWGNYYTVYLHKCNKRKCKTRNKRYGKYVKEIKRIFPDYIRDGLSQYYNIKHIVLKEVGYRQGWWFNKKLFTSSDSIYMAFNKKDADRLMKNLFKMNEEGREAYKYFTNLMNDLEDETFILEIAW